MEILVRVLLDPAQVSAQRAEQVAANLVTRVEGELRSVVCSPLARHWDYEVSGEVVRA